MQVTAASELFTEFLREIDPALKREGFSKRDNTFYLKHEGNLAMVDFQKSQMSDAISVKFTINLAVASALLLNFHSPHRKKSMPKLDECHWRQRIGFLLQERADHWWTVNNSNSAKETANEVTHDLMTIAIPELKKYTSNEALRDLWISGTSPGLTEIQRLMNLSVLLVELGPGDLLPQIVMKLRQTAEGKATEGIVKNHISELEKIVRK